MYSTDILHDKDMPQIFVLLDYSTHGGNRELILKLWDLKLGLASFNPLRTDFSRVYIFADSSFS